MAVEIPSMLISEIQATLRREAGIPSYDPTHPSVPSLSPLLDAISALDPTLSPHLRCIRCRGGLLRGPESTICIFCGADRRREAPAQTLSFNSTAACRKLLESLGLDGSEAVSLDTESGDSNKGRDEPKEVLVLSGLLDLELRRPVDKYEIDNNGISKMPTQLPLVKEETDYISTNKSFSQSSYASNLSGVDLDTFFSDSKKEDTSTSLTSSSEQLNPKKQIEDTDGHTIPSSLNFGSFGNFQSSNVEVCSDNAKNGDIGDSFADWEPDFQFSSSQASVAESKSLDLFQGSSTIEFVVPASAASIVDDNDDSFDAWQDFTSSVDATGVSSNSWAENGTEARTSGHASEVKSVDIKDMDLVNFFDSDSFTGVVGDEKGYHGAKSIQLNTSVSERISRINGENNVDSTVQEAMIIDQNFTAAQDQESSNSNVEKLLAQLHDLSFMLENSLSIPEKVSGSGLNL